jgi:hypothetical protein
MGFYTSWLVIPSIIGLMTVVFGLATYGKDAVSYDAPISLLKGRGGLRVTVTVTIKAMVRVFLLL